MNKKLIDIGGIDERVYTWYEKFDENNKSLGYGARFYALNNVSKLTVIAMLKSNADRFLEMGLNEIEVITQEFNSAFKYCPNRGWIIVKECH